MRKTKYTCYSLAVTSNIRATQSPLPPTGVRRRIERNREKLVGRDKGSLTEQQTKGTGTTTTPIRRIYKTKQQNAESHSHRLPLPRALEPRDSEFLSRRPPHRNPAWWHMVWNTRLCLARWGQPARLCPFLDSGEN